MQTVKKILVIVCFSIYSNSTMAQADPVSIVTAAVKKVIRAIDLKIQRLQNKTIWLQNAQKVIENKMSKLKLEEISDWSNKQKELYADYFKELYSVKKIISNHSMLKNILSKQLMVIKEYRSSWSYLNRSTLFQQGELKYMDQVYQGMLKEGLKALDDLWLIVKPDFTQMTDGMRLDMMRSVDNRLTQHLTDLRKFNQSNGRLAMNRTTSYNEIALIKKIYGL